MANVNRNSVGYSKVFAIGVDGGTLELVQSWVQAGKLPTFARMMAQGAVGELESTIPPITSFSLARSSFSPPGRMT